MSMLPPPRVGGMLLSSGSVGRPASANATPITPMNGFSGNVTSPFLPRLSTPLATPLRPRRTGVNTETLPYLSGSPVGRPSVATGGMTSSSVMPSGAPPFACRASAPLPWRLDTTPYGTRGSMESISTLSTSPGRAPATWIGPVTTWGPSRSKSLGVRS